MAVMRGIFIVVFILWGIGFIINHIQEDMKTPEERAQERLRCIVNATTQTERALCPYQVQ
jgi:hypothetical protein